MDLTPKAHTQAILKRMNLAGSVPANIDRNNDAQADNYGLASAGSSDSSSFKLSGAPKSPHMGRPGRQAGGRITGSLIRTRRTPEETAKDIADEDSIVDSLARDRQGRANGGGVRSEGARDAENAERVQRMSASERDAYANERRGGRVGRSTGGQATAKSEYTQAGQTYENEDASGKDRFTGGNYAPSRASGGRVDRAHGGRTKGKTTVNVIIGGQKTMPPAGGPPMPPPPMAAPGPVGPPRPPPPGMPPAGGMPLGGAPLGAAGAPPPGAPPMLRARGGRIEIGTPGKHDYGRAGLPHGSTNEQYGGGSGLGRQERARHQK